VITNDSRKGEKNGKEEVIIGTIPCQVGVKHDDEIGRNNCQGDAETNDEIGAHGDHEDNEEDNDDDDEVVVVGTIPCPRVDKTPIVYQRRRLKR
jgi:hypothetical protein